MTKYITFTINNIYICIIIHKIFKTIFLNYICMKNFDFLLVFFKIIIDKNIFNQSKELNKINTMLFIGCEWEL